MTTSMYEPLTDRQLEVGRMISRGMSNDEIASELGISPRTVKAHSDVLRDKLDVPRKRMIGQKMRDLGLTE